MAHAARMDRDGAGMARRDSARDRRDLVSGDVLPDHCLIRFVAAPDGHVVPDVAGKLPGRGLWVKASRAALDQAVKKNLFARAAKAAVVTDSDLAERTQKALAAHMLAGLGLARRAGGLVTGFDQVLKAIEGPRPPALLIAARDGAAEGRRKLAGAAHGQGLKVFMLECFTSAELDLALGRENVIHAAVQPGGLAARLILDAQRLSGLRNERDS